MATQTLKQRAVQVLQRTWQAIGYDTLQAYADEKGRRVERIVISRDDVIDSVSACGFKGGYPEMYGDDLEATVWLEQQPREVQDGVLREAFPHTRYGL